MLLYLFGSGLGAYFVGFFLKIPHLENNLDYHWPIDLWVPEANIFLTLYQSPHFILSLTLLILIFLFLLLAWEQKKWSYSLGATFLALILFNFHPYHVVTVWGVTGIYLLVDLVRKRRLDYFKLKSWLVLIIFSLPSIAYHYWLIIKEPVIAWRALQNVDPSPDLLFVLLGFGMIFLVALIGIYFLAKTGLDDRYWFSISWLFTGLVFVYLPAIPFARRLTEGLEVPMVVLAIPGLFYLLAQARKLRLAWLTDNPYLLTILFLFFFSFSTIFNLGRDLFYFYERLPPFYFSREKKLALDWLGQRWIENKVVLAGLLDSNLIVGFTPRAVYFGHGNETIFPEIKARNLVWFFRDNKNNERRREFLEKNNIGYLFWSEEESGWGNFSPAQAPYLKLVYQNSEVAIYQLR